MHISLQQSDGAQLCAAFWVAPCKSRRLGCRAFPCSSAPHSVAPQSVVLAAGKDQEQGGSADDMEASQDVLTMDDTEDTAGLEDKDMAEPDPDAGMDSGKRWEIASLVKRLVGRGPADP